MSECEWQETCIQEEFQKKMICFRVQANIPLSVSRDQNGMFLRWLTYPFYSMTYQYFFKVS